MFVTKKINQLSLNYSKDRVDPIQKNGVFVLSSIEEINDITVLLNEDTNEPVN